MWMAGKKEGGRSMSAAKLELWQTAPATAAVRERPVHELLHCQREMDALSEQIRVIDDLLRDPEVCELDRLALAMEKAVAKCRLLACANIITACEETMRRQAARMQARHGFLL